MNERSHSGVSLRERVIWFPLSWLFQSYFSRGGAPFIGMIVSPYDPANRSPHSQTTCLLVKESQEPSGPQSTLNTHTQFKTSKQLRSRGFEIKLTMSVSDFSAQFNLWLSLSLCSSPELPYRFDFLSSQDIPDWEQTLRRAQWIIHKYCQTPGWVSIKTVVVVLTCLSCLVECLNCSFSG